MAKKVCKKCGEANLVSSMICFSCGDSLTSAKVIGVSDDIKYKGISDDVKSKKENICPECGENIHNGVRNCPACGSFICKTTENVIYEKPNNYYETSSSDGNGFLYFMSLLIPLVGFIAGAIYLTSDDAYKKDAGGICIFLGIISVVIGVVLLNI